MIFLFLLSRLKAFVTSFLALFCVYSIYCDNKYYVKRPFYFVSGYIYPDVFTRAAEAQTGPAPVLLRSCSGPAPSLWRFAVMLFLQHVVFNTLLFLQQNVVNHCGHWLLRVLNKFWTSFEHCRNIATARLFRVLNIVFYIVLNI